MTDTLPWTCGGPPGWRLPPPPGASIPPPSGTSPGHLPSPQVPAARISSTATGNYAVGDSTRPPMSRHVSVRATVLATEPAGRLRTLPVGVTRIAWIGGNYSRAVPPFSVSWCRRLGGSVVLGRMPVPTTQYCGARLRRPDGYGPLSGPSPWPARATTA